MSTIAALHQIPWSGFVVKIDCWEREAEDDDLAAAPGAH